MVLNSAERAPYLLLVEILHNDLDFDPTKRGNREIIKKIVVKENERAGTGGDIISFHGPSSPVPQMARTRSQSGPDADKIDGTLEVDTANLVVEDMSDESAGPLVTPVTSPTEEEEVDLVEQLYGSDGSLRSQSFDLSESIVLPPVPKNKELDMATWSSTPSSPQVSADISSSQVPSRSALSKLRHSTSRPDLIPKVLSLDEYSERMRTAAVMLAQLNANLVREPMGSLVPPGTPNPLESPSPLRWLPGSSWLSVTPPVTDANSANGDAGPSTPQIPNAPMRMKLQPSEAAAIRDRIMNEMLALEEERMERMRENRVGEGTLTMAEGSGSLKTAEDEGIIRRELSKADPSAVVVGESWAAKKVPCELLLLSAFL